MSLKDVYENEQVCKMEEKFSLIKRSETEFLGKYPLEPFRADARGTYGGEFVAQALRAAWELISDSEFEIHLLHLYFLKAGLMESVMRYEVVETSEGRNMCLRLVKCYQNSQLCFTMLASFCRNNNIRRRKQEFAALSAEEQANPRTRVPFEFLRKPHYTFYKYKDRLDDMNALEHTNGNLTHVLLPETFRGPKKQREAAPAERQFGLFFKVNDNVEKAHNKLITKMVDFAYVSDSFYLGTVLRAVFPTLEYKKTDFFRVSLDHTIYYHDTDFDPTQWMFLDYTFQRLSNDRVLVTSQYFTLDERLVATVLQEALCLFPLTLIRDNKLGSYKL